MRSHLLITVRKRSCGKVMFSQACVKNSVGGGGACMAGGVCGRGNVWWACVAGGMHGMGACVAGGCMFGRVCAWQGSMRRRGACVAGETATAADGTHPTGMHSCN